MRRVMICCAILLSGCAASQWSRPGATPSDLEQDRSTCNTKALNTLPVNMVMMSTGWDTPPRRECSQTSNGQNCISVPGIPASPRPTDINEAARAKLTDACLKSLGWSK